MNVGRLKSSRGWKCSSIPGLAVVLASLLCPRLQCLGQQFSAPFADPLKINWVSGPQNASLGDLAIHIPKAYRLTDAHGAQVILESMDQPVPDDLVGALSSDSGQWQAVLEYSHQGWVKDTDAAKINPAKLLKTIQRQLAHGTSAATSMKWLSPPVYDRQRHSLSWSYQVQTSSGKSLSETVVLLGRKGVLRITSVKAGASAASPSLAKLAGNIAFKNGQRYADYQNGDKIAEVGLAGLVTGAKDSAGIFSGFGSAAALAYSGLAACALLGSVIVMRKRGRRRQPKGQPQPRTQTRAPVPPLAAATATENGTAITTGPANGNGMATPVKAASPAFKNGEVNGRAVAPRQFQRNRRKRIFDYPKFYTNVITELSRSYTAPGANGQTNGHANGKHAVKSEIVELITTQKNLIQEQKCLLEQQTRLIEEKRWLIEEQTAFLRAQSRADDLQYPLKFE
jgi:uncharacterized membrane-anchored protein